MPSKTAQVVVPKEVEQELTMLRGFRDLVGERWGYFLGRRMTQTEMNDATKVERKKVSGIRKEIAGNLDALIAGETILEDFISSYNTKQAELKTAREVVSKKSKPFREKISPIAKAQKYLDTVAIPDALKELGTPVQPRFSLSKWIDNAMKSEK